MTKHNIGTVEDFSENEGTEVDIDGIKLAVFKVDGDIYAIQDRCPHKNLPLHLAGKDSFTDEDSIEGVGKQGKVNAEKRSINCPWHYLEWNLETGENPVIDQRIPTFDVEIVDDNVLVEI